MHAISTRHSYVRLNNSYVHLVQYGNGERIIKSTTESPTTSIRSQNHSPIIGGLDSRHKLDDIRSKNNNTNGKKLIIFLPGNPGLLGAYHDYLVLLYKTLCKRGTEANGNENSGSVEQQDDFILLAISHNNFDHPNDSFAYIKTDDRITLEEGDLNFIEQSIAKAHEPNDVELQVLNKLIILKHLLKYNLEDCQLIFVGHSIGCYIILRLLQDNLIASVHQGSIMIHPALENLALTEKGTYFARLFSLKVDYLLRSLAYCAELLLPKSTRLVLTKHFVCTPELVEKSSPIVIESLAQLCCSNALRAMIEMAKSEFLNIKNLDHSLLIKPHLNRLKLIYAKTDHWVNAQNRKLLNEFYPNLYIEEQQTMHAFIMEPKTVIDYALKVANFIQEFVDF